jgi:hypothetical protein
MTPIHAGQAVAIAAALLAGPFTTASAANAVTAGAPERLLPKFSATLVARHSGKCLDVAGVSTADGANVHQWTCLFAQRNQEWRLVQKDNGYFTVVARHSGKCLDVAGVSISEGANVHQWTCLPGQRNQEWRLA